MTILDWILIIILIGFVLSCMKQGLIYSFGSFLGLFLGTFIAGRFYDNLAVIFGGGNWSKVISFIIIFTIVSNLVGLIFYIINKIFKILTVIPFLGLINHLGGAIFGFIQGVLFIGIILFFLSRFDLATVITNALGGSILAPLFTKVGGILAPFFPKIIREIKSII